MYRHANGWVRAWMVPVMLLWTVVLGLAVYAAVRLAPGHDGQPPVRQ